MTQTELNQLFAEAYRVAAEREEYGEASLNKIEQKAVCEQYCETMPINQDTLKLFQLCIENGLRIGHFPSSVVVDKYPFGLDFGFAVAYEKHETKETAACSAMFEALCKLKNIRI